VGCKHRRTSYDLDRDRVTEKRKLEGGRPPGGKPTGVATYRPLSRGRDMTSSSGGSGGKRFTVGHCGARIISGPERNTWGKATNRFHLPAGKRFGGRKGSTEKESKPQKNQMLELFPGRGGKRTLWVDKQGGTQVKVRTGRPSAG